MTEAKLIDLENVELHMSHKETIWDIENKEKLQLIKFIERQIMLKISPIIDEKDKKIDMLEKKINTLNNDFQIKIVGLENELTILKNEISKQNKKIETIENKVGIIKEKCNEFIINVSNKLEEISEKLFNHSVCLSNQHIYLNPYNGRNRPGKEHVISIGSKELYLTEFPLDWDDRGIKSLEQIECLYQLNKIYLQGYVLNVVYKADIDEKIFRKIKNSYVKILAIQNCIEWNFVSSLPIIMPNMPNLEKLEMIAFNSIDNLVDNLSKTSHTLKEIKFTNCYKIDVTKIKEYCIGLNIELVIS